jgi:hypothetical protein
VLSLLAVLVATVIGPAWPPAPSLTAHDLATLTDAEARQLAGRRALFRVVLDGEPDGTPRAAGGTTAGGKAASCGRSGFPTATTWSPTRRRGSGLLVVEATLHRVAHRAVSGADGSRLPALVEYRLTDARVVDRPGW